jgi:hypothetical protein
MVKYFEAKAAEYALVLRWISQELQALELQRPVHQPLFERLQTVLSEAEELQHKLEILLRVGHPRLRARALPMIHELEYFTTLFSHYYLPALQKEGAAELQVRGLLLGAAASCGLSWVKDMIVRLDGAHATLPIATLIETPLIIAPPQQAISLLDWPGLYHELGHNVFENYSAIGAALSQVVSKFFTEFRQQAGPMSPVQHAERQRALQQAERYWSVGRLNELFCDVFATFTCGPAHYISCIDLALRNDDDPFLVDSEDVHPPLAARVYACYRALFKTHRGEPIVISARDTWQAYQQRQPGSAQYDLTCPSDLLDRLVRAATQNIQQYLPMTKRYSKLLPNENEIEQLPVSASLEDILNQGAKLLLTHPEHYAQWEVSAYQMLLSHINVPSAQPVPVK